MSPFEPMRVLFTTIAHPTHYYSMVPLAWALRCAGHEVRVASQPSLADAVTRSGLTFVPVGEDHQWAEKFAANTATAGTAPRIDFTDLLADPDPHDLLGFYTILVPGLFAPLNNKSMVDGLVTFAEEWEPDLVCWEPLTWAGAIAATVTGAAHARLLWSADVLGATRQAFLDAQSNTPGPLRDDPLEEWLTWTLRKYGRDFDETVVEGHWVVDQESPSLSLSTAQPRLPMSYVPYNGPALVPDWVREKPDRPRVCVTLGVSARSGLGHTSVPLGELVRALASPDIELVVTAGAAQRGELGRLPSSVRLVENVPMHALLPTCAAVIHHGGAGTWCTALRSGTPQLVLPDIWDAPWKAARLAEHGAGLVEPASTLTVESVRDKLQRLLDDPSYRRESERLRAELLAQPSPAEVADELIRRTREHAARRA